MKRNINEIYELIKEKISNAENDLYREKTRVYPSTKKQYELKGEIDAYKDVLNLIETSQVLVK